MQLLGDKETVSSVANDQWRSEALRVGQSVCRRLQKGFFTCQADKGLRVPWPGKRPQSHAAAASENDRMDLS
jgi:hypothetical protein